MNILCLHETCVDTLPTRNQNNPTSFQFFSRIYGLFARIGMQSILLNTLCNISKMSFLWSFDFLIFHICADNGLKMVRLTVRNPSFDFSILRFFSAAQTISFDFWQTQKIVPQALQHFFRSSRPKYLNLGFIIFLSQILTFSWRARISSWPGQITMVGFTLECPTIARSPHLWAWICTKNFMNSSDNIIDVADSGTDNPVSKSKGRCKAGARY